MIRYFLLNIATWNIFFLRLKAGSSPTPPDITSGPKMASFPSTSFFCVWKSNTSPSWTLRMYIYVFLFSEPTLILSERTSKTGNQHILSGQLVREKSKKWLCPRAGRGEWIATKKYKKNDKAVLYFAHICTYIVFVFTILSNRGGEKYIHLFMHKLFAKEVKTAFKIPPPLLEKNPQGRIWQTSSGFLKR